MFSDYSTKIYSDKHDERVHARAELIRRTNSFKECRRFQNAPKWEELSSLVKKTLETGEFPYQINDKKAGVIYKTYPINQPNVKQIEAGDPQTKPAYVIMLAHLMNYSNPNETAKIEEQIRLLKSEGFRKTNAKSIQHANQRQRIVIGANHCYTLLPRINKGAKEYVNSLEALTSDTLHVAAFAWRPIWVDKESGTEVDHKKVKRFFRLILEINSTKAKAIFQKLMLSKVVPMQRIRQEILQSPSVKSHIISLRRGRANRPTFLATWDDDAITLRTDGVGVFTHYDRLIRKNPNMILATTGYSMTDPNKNFVEFASTADLVARRALGRFAYPPEPNLIFKVEHPVQNALSTLSFIRKGPEKGKGLESIGLIESLNLTYLNSSGKYVFGREGAIVTAAARASVPLHIADELEGEDFVKSQTLASLRGFMQSVLDPTYGFSASIARTMPGMGSQPVKKHIASIYKCFDPVEYSKRISNWYEFYPDLIKNIDELNRKKTTIKKLQEYWDDQLIMDLLKEMQQNLSEATDSLYLSHPQMNGVKVNLIIQKSMDMGLAVYHYLSSRMNDTPFVFPNIG